MFARTYILYYQSMDASQRLSELVDVLRRDGRVDVATAAAEFGTAELTIRRDLDVLVERGVARRVRGGAVNLLMRGEELPFAMRAIEAADHKRRIAEASGRRLTVMPMSLHAAMALSGSASVRLMLPGGEARPGELAMVGPLALAGIRALRFDTVVLGCCGVSPEGDVMAHDLGDAAVKQALLASGGRSVLAVDGAKFGRAALAVVGPLAALDVVVTDDTAPEPAVAALRAAGVEVHRV
jgi:DeoR/GlpR family transcriptional regulator of sugar metabolism